MSWILGAIGGFILFLYGIVPTFQSSYFHRIYAAYGGIFIVMASEYYTLGSGSYTNLGVLGGHKKASVLFLAHPCEK
jgi:drug/metabolite transporter superfamily protein YnfA